MHIYIVYQQNKEYSKRVDDHYKITQRLYKQIREKYGAMLLHSEECIGGDEPYIIATLCIGRKIQNKMKKLKKLISPYLYIKIIYHIYTNGSEGQSEE